MIIILLLIYLFFSLWGGGLLICEKILDEDKRGPKQALLQSLSMLVATGGKERTASEYKQILDKHGFIVTQINQLDQCPFMDVILCLKKWGLFRVWTELFLPFVIEIDVYNIHSLKKVITRLIDIRVPPTGFETILSFSDCSKGGWQLSIR